MSVAPSIYAAIDSRTGLSLISAIPWVIRCDKQGTRHYSNSVHGRVSMKESTVHSLVIARTLFDRAESLCHSEDRYLASAGLVIVQDALEIILYALLIELEVDEETSLEKKGFDELIGELKKAGYPLSKSGTLKALNKQRVLTKHYAQMAEPITVRTYFSVAKQASDDAILAITKRSIRDLFIADFLINSEAKNHLKQAECEIYRNEYLAALIEIRKAIYIEFEEDYSVYSWRDYDHNKQEGLGLWMIGRGGWRAPYWTRNKDWIESHVNKPTDYIQIDNNNWTLQALELGIHTAELENLRRLTPAVFRANPKEEWSIAYDAGFPENNGNDSNARYCLDRAVFTILKKQEHETSARHPCADYPVDSPNIYIGRQVYKRPNLGSEVIHTIANGYDYKVRMVLSGFNPEEKFIELSGWLSDEAMEKHPEADPGFHRGYLQLRPEEEI